MNRLTAILAVTAMSIYADANATNHRTTEINRAQDQEQAKWDRRLAQAEEHIEIGFRADHSRNYVSETEKTRVATYLLAEARQNCRNRRDIPMSYTEKQIETFMRTGQ